MYSNQLNKTRLVKLLKINIRYLLCLTKNQKINFFKKSIKTNFIAIDHRLEKINGCQLLD